MLSNIVSSLTKAPANSRAIDRLPYKFLLFLNNGDLGDIFELLSARLRAYSPFIPSELLISCAISSKPIETLLDIIVSSVTICNDRIGRIGLYCLSTSFV